MAVAMYEAYLPHQLLQEGEHLLIAGPPSRGRDPEVPPISWLLELAMLEASIVEVRSPGPKVEVCHPLPWIATTFKSVPLCSL